MSEEFKAFKQLLEHNLDKIQSDFEDALRKINKDLIRHKEAGAVLFTEFRGGESLSNQVVIILDPIRDVKRDLQRLIHNIKM